MWVAALGKLTTALPSGFLFLVRESSFEVVLEIPDHLRSDLKVGEELLVTGRYDPSTNVLAVSAVNPVEVCQMLEEWRLLKEGNNWSSLDELNRMFDSVFEGRMVTERQR